MLRDGLFRPVCVGGAGVVHLYARQLAARFSFFRDCSHAVKGAFLQVNFRALLLNLEVSSNLLTARSSLLGFTQEVYASVHF